MDVENGMITIQISNEGLERANATLKSMREKLPSAISRTVNRTMDGLRTDAVSETHERYFVKAKDVRSSLTFKKATSGNLMGEMISRGKRHSLADYQLTPSTPRKGKKIQLKGAVKREGGLKSLGPAFLVKRSGGKYFPFYRIGKGKWKMNSLISPSMPQIIKNEETVKAIEKGAEERFSKRLDHEVMRLIGMLP